MKLVGAETSGEVGGAGITLRVGVLAGGDDGL